MHARAIATQKYIINSGSLKNDASASVSVLSKNWPQVTQSPHASSPLSGWPLGAQQNRLGDPHLLEQYPSLRSKKTISDRMMRNATKAVSTPMSVASSQPWKRSQALRMAPRSDRRARVRSRRTRVDSLMASCSQSIVTYEAYHTRVPFARLPSSSPSSKVP